MNDFILFHDPFDVSIMTNDRTKTPGRVLGMASDGLRVFVHLTHHYPALQWINLVDIHPVEYIPSVCCGRKDA